MITAWTIYWLTRLDAINDSALTVCILSGMLGFLVLLWLVVENDLDSTAEHLKLKRTLKISGISFLLSSLTLIVVPTTNQMAAILVIPAVANSQTTKELGDATVTLAKRWLEELRPNKAKK